MRRPCSRHIVATVVEELILEPHATGFIPANEKNYAPVNFSICRFFFPLVIGLIEKYRRQLDSPHPTSPHPTPMCRTRYLINLFSFYLWLVKNIKEWSRKLRTFYEIALYIDQDWFIVIFRVLYNLYFFRQNCAKIIQHRLINSTNCSTIHEYRANFTWILANYGQLRIDTRTV